MAVGRPQHSDTDMSPGSASMTSRLVAPGLMICRLSGPLYYHNAERLIDELTLVVRSASSVRWLVLRFSSVGDVDYVGAKMLMELFDRMQQQGTTLVFAKLSTKVRNILSDLGVLAAIGSDKEFPSVKAAHSAYRQLERVSRNRFANPGQA